MVHGPWGSASMVPKRVAGGGGGRGLGGIWSGSGSQVVHCPEGVRSGGSSGPRSGGGGQVIRWCMVRCFIFDQI